MTKNPNSTDYQREAVAWLQRLKPKTATPKDVEAFKTWCLEDPAHAQAFVKMRHLWEAVRPIGKRLLKENPAEDLAWMPDPPHILLQRRTVLTGTLAASAIAASYAAIHPPLGLWPSLSELRADYRTATGERRQIALANDIAIDMNTQTSIALRSEEEGIDRIELIAGEGLVQAKSHPLEVAAAGGSVWAANATFNVRRDGERVSVTSLDGEVVVKCAAVSARLPTGRQVAYSGARLGSVAQTDPASVTSWRDGFLVFHDTPLLDVIDEINRYRRGRIIVANAALGRRSVNGRFYLARLDEVIEKFRNAFGAQATTLPGGAIVILS